MKKSVIYLVLIIFLIGSGHVSGRLLFSDRLADASDNINNGERLYAVNCSGCHPNGGNLINSSLPVINSPILKDLDTFVNFVRNPRRPDGSPGAMQAFSKNKLSDQQLRTIYHYIINSLARKRS